jgi:serine/threonine protein kinase
MFPQIFGKYVLEREIAAGGMARVYLATLRGAVGFEKRLVVKQIRTELASDQAFVTRFVEEAKTAVELSHPNIVPVYELGVEQGVYYIAMELCEGLTLSEVLAETGPLGPAEGAYVGAEICRALDYAHRRANIVHRDVTPRNVLIDDEGAVRLIDFGIAAPVTRVDDATRSEIFGSPGHMPPEQLNGADLSPATDVFAVGVLLIEAWTGYPPFRRATAQESEHALFDVPPAIERQQPQLAPLSALIASSVALDARHRPSAAEHLARPLREFLKSEDSGDIARRLGERVRRARQRARSSSPWLPGERGTGPSDLKTRSLDSQPPLDRGLARPASSPVTRTFAAREDLEVWTRKLASAPALLLPTPAATPHSRRVAQAARDAGGGQPSAISASEASRGPSTSNTGFVLFAVSSAAFIVAAFAFAPHAMPRASAVSGPTGASAMETKAGLPIREQAAAQAALTAALVPARNARLTAQKSIGPARSPSVSSAEANADPALLGTLKITADPPATVELSGPHVHQVGQTPIVGLKVLAGRYQVLFRNGTFGAPLAAQVMVVAGGSRSVHADFRRAEPAVTIH